MKNYSKFLFAFAITSIFVFTSCNQEKDVEKVVKKTYNQEDYNNVKTAILDYVEGIYMVDSTRIDKSVDKKLHKIGYWFHPDKKEYVDNLKMTHTQLSNLAANWNKSGKRANEKSPKEIEIYEVNTKTASAKLTAEWGIDFFHLGKVDGQWKIVNVIWQSQPNEEK